MSERRDNSIPRAVFLVCAILTGLWLLWDVALYRLVHFSLWADYWEHTAALTEWLRNPSAPGNPHLADGSSSARYIPSFWLLTVLGGALGLDALDLMGIHAVVNYLLLATGVYLFTHIYFRNPWAPAVTLIVLLCGWGVPWIWSNLYELRSLFVTASYPSTFVLGLSLVSFWLILAFMRGHVAFFTSILCLLLLSALMFVSHPLTGAFAVGAGCLLALTERDAAVSLRALIILALVSGPLLASLWPMFPIWDVILASSAEVDDRTWQGFTGVDGMLERARSGIWWHMLYDPRDLFVALGPALLGVPLAAWLLFRRHHLFLPLGAMMMAVPYFGNIFVQVALAHRFLFYITFFLHLAIAWGILELFDRWAAERRENTPTSAVTVSVSVVRVLVALAVVGHIALLAADYRGMHLKHTLEVVDKRSQLPFEFDVPRMYRELTAALPERAVVLGEPRLTWPLPTFRGKTVALPENHENSLVTDQFTRVADVQRFLAAGTPASERERVLDAYGVTHVLVNTRQDDPALLRWLDERTATVTTVGWYQMRELLTAARGRSDAQSTTVMP